MNRCKCTPLERKRYVARISGPIMDRIDIFAQAPRVQISDLNKPGERESSLAIRNRIIEVRERQAYRYRDTKYHFNSQLENKDIGKYCKLERKEQKFLETAGESMNLSVRAYHKVLKVARTIADMAGTEKIEEMHLAEAICYRITENPYWKEEA